MSQTEIPDVVRSFVAQHIDSAELLETLLLVHSGAEREWTPEAGGALHLHRARRGHAPPGAAGGHGAGVVQRRGEPGVPLRPRERRAGRRRWTALAAAYRASRVAVINLIYNKPPDPLRSFADAFKLRKD